MWFLLNLLYVFYFSEYYFKLAISVDTKTPPLVTGLSLQGQRQKYASNICEYTLRFMNNDIK